jgi:imidazoleglycerol-phosphate dehydratase
MNDESTPTSPNEGPAAADKQAPEEFLLEDGSLYVRLEGGEIDTTIRPSRLRWVESRTAQICRETGETNIDLRLNLDGRGAAEVATGVGFFDHMLTLLARHSLIDLTVKVVGDLHVDAHHTVEDVGICFGQALAQALGDKAGVRRYGDATVPMDEALVTAAVDLSGRPFCVWKVELPPEMLGTFNAPLAEEFWRAASSSGAFALHVLCHHGRNSHHVVECVFKAAARALRAAVEPDPRSSGVPSTKGVLTEKHIPILDKGAPPGVQRR